MTCIFSACSAVRFDATRTALAGHCVLRWCVAARAVSDATESLMILRRRSEPRFAPLESIGVDEPMFVVGAIASTSAACDTQTPADAARAPFGDTYTITGSFAFSSALKIVFIDVDRPPGVSRRMTAAA